MSSPTLHSTNATTLLGSEFGERSLLHSVGSRPATEVLQNFLIATLALTLVLATMGNLGAGALVIGPALAIAMVVGRAVAMNTNAVDDTQA